MSSSRYVSTGVGSIPAATTTERWIATLKAGANRRLTVVGWELTVHSNATLGTLSDVNAQIQLARAATEGSLGSSLQTSKLSDLSPAAEGVGRGQSVTEGTLGDILEAYYIQRTYTQLAVWYPLGEGIEVPTSGILVWTGQKPDTAVPLAVDIRLFFEE